jgi:putative acyl-CoA dehydrogenase
MPQQLDTHVVENQPLPLVDYNLYSIDIGVQEALAREGGAWALDSISQFGHLLGQQKVLHDGHLANKFPPQLKTFDRYGHRIDEVEFHPAYHNMMRLGKENGVHCVAWTSKNGGHVVHTALEYLLSQVEGGVCCPLTMTYAAIPSLQNNQELSENWIPKILMAKYDNRFLPAEEKNSLMMGMAMTEKQGGSDVRSNTTIAKKITQDRYLLTGHKWFCSAPMSDAFLTLAQTSKGLTCFFVPRFLPDGTKNRIFIQRLKDKLGNHSNASSEIEYNDTWAIRVGDEGRGVSTIIEMVHHTRLDCCTAATSFMRQSLTQAVHHAKHRKAFGKLLINQPLMKNVIADLVLEWESALMLTFRIARAYDSDSTEEKAFARLAVAIAKYWTNKRCSYFVNEAMECLGGAGYVEESNLPRLYREAPLNGIWEGSGNVICLDVLRSIHKDPTVLDVFFAEVEPVIGLDCRFDNFLNGLKKDLSSLESAQYQARFITEKMALCLQSALYIQHGNQTSVDAFLQSRIAGRWGKAFGTLPVGIEVDSILNRAIKY